MNPPRIVVSSISFSRHAGLRHELLEHFPDARFCTGERILAGDELTELLRGAEGAIVGMEIVDDALLATLPDLQIVSKYGVGLDNIDQAACDRRGVVIGWTGGVNARSVAEMTLCFMLGLCHNMFKTASMLRQGEWLKRGGTLLGGRTVGIIGLGHIGQDLVRLLAPLGCRILANDIADRSAFCSDWQVETADKLSLYATSDIVTLHVPLTPLTRKLIDEQTLARFRPGAMLINTSRGPVVDQAALHAALESGHLGGAALDVFDPEPPTDRSFLNLPTLVTTPHIGGNAEEAVLAMGRSAIRHLMSHFSTG